MKHFESYTALKKEEIMRNLITICILFWQVVKCRLTTKKDSSGTWCPCRFRAMQPAMLFVSGIEAY
jgi:hypothetical protein